VLRYPRPPQTIILVPVHTAVWPCLPVGAPSSIDVAAQLSVAGSYRPPEFVPPVPSSPPQTIISVPVQTAEEPYLGVGTPGPVDVFVQVSVAGSYRPPLFKL
jgi:hypothetical protein